MQPFIKNYSLIFCIGLFTASFSIHGQGNMPATADFEDERNIEYANQLESYLRQYLVDQYEERAEKAWDRDYSSIDAFLRSVKPNRQRWESVVVKPPKLIKTGPPEKKPYVIENVKGEWIELNLGPIAAQAFLAFPDGADELNPVPIVIVQHGIGSTPETAFRRGSYNECAKELLKAGYAVLVPLNLRSVDLRNRIERLCRLADTSLPGIELVRLQNLLDIVLEDPRVDRERVGMWGQSLGGLATMFWMPLEPRIKVGVVSAWYNHRLNKMVIPDDRYTCFLETREEHAFFSGWLSEFTDSDVASLICPRPLQIVHGKADRIAHWPQVIEEYEVAKTHYVKLNIEERIDLVIHDEGHIIIVDEGIAFLNKWLYTSPPQ